MDKLAKVIRMLTVAPVMACVLLVTLFLAAPEVYGRTADFVCALVFLTILPVLAYPMQPILPGYRDRGREGQRSLAMVFAVSGYVLGCLVNLFLRAPQAMWIIYLEYLLSGGLILLFNKCFHVKASAHACGVAGPCALLLHFHVPALIPGIAALALTWWASLKMKRHTASQLAGGTVIPVAVLCLLALLFRTGI